VEIHKEEIHKDTPGNSIFVMIARYLDDPTDGGGRISSGMKSRATLDAQAEARMPKPKEGVYAV
jgi:hypothetical protein